MAAAQNPVTMYEASSLFEEYFIAQWRHDLIQARNGLRCNTYPAAGGWKIIPDESAELEQQYAQQRADALRRPLHTLDTVNDGLKSLVAGNEKAEK